MHGKKNEEVYDDSAYDAYDAKRDQMQIVVLLRCLVMVMTTTTMLMIMITMMMMVMMLLVVKTGHDRTPVTTAGLAASSIWRSSRCACCHWWSARLVVMLRVWVTEIGTTKATYEYE